ncbi:MAG TPA: ubiquinol-cytochrome C chaperone family protein [Pseudolabrys sp.]|nr:ubiquinol-cytochrome C chaperone family protein [Pseudolabrys sp.]
MKFPLFRRRERSDTISALYGTIVAQARLPCFYREYGVPDTVNGRFDLLVLHLALVLDRLADEPQLRELGQSLFDHFCTDMDRNLREMGIGDLSVPKHMQHVGEAFYGRAQAYRAGLTHNGDGALTEALERNIYGQEAANRAAAARLAAYMRETVADLRAQPASQLLAGKLTMPNPAATVPVEHEASGTKD